MCKLSTKPTETLEPIKFVFEKSFNALFDVKYCKLLLLVKLPSLSANIKVFAFHPLVCAELFALVNAALAYEPALVALVSAVLAAVNAPFAYTPAAVAVLACVKAPFAYAAAEFAV